MKETKKLRSFLDAQIGKGNIHSVVAAVQSYDHSLDFVGAAGVADPEAGAVMTLDTPYFIGSITKTYTAAITMSLYEKSSSISMHPSRIICQHL
jgi:CubicO group peptidase (beta-lactamase class C family)